MAASPASLYAPSSPSRFGDGTHGQSVLCDARELRGGKFYRVRGEPEVVPLHAPAPMEWGSSAVCALHSVTARTRETALMGGAHWQCLVQSRGQRWLQGGPARQEIYQMTRNGRSKKNSLACRARSAVIIDQLEGRQDNYVRRQHDKVGPHVGACQQSRVGA
jgi:hypothetical protein